MSHPKLPLAGFDGARDDKLFRILHEIAKENKGKSSFFEVSNLLFP
jgi:hypothetical protein